MQAYVEVIPYDIVRSLSTLTRLNPRQDLSGSSPKVHKSGIRHLDLQIIRSSRGVTKIVAGD